MKHYQGYLWNLVLAGLLGGCQLAGTGGTITGTFVNAAASELAEARDTLEITSGGGGHYVVERRTAFRAIRSGKYLPERHRVQRFEAVWDAKSRQLDELTTGRVFRLDSHGDLHIRQALYRRVR